MGKKSLLKSTSKKGGKNKTQQAKPDSVTTEEKAATGKKTSTKTKAPSKKQVPEGKKPTLESLIQKKFDAWKPEIFYTPPVDTADANQFSAPPFWDDSADHETYHKLLFRKYSSADLAKAAQEAEAKAKAEAEAKAKAEAEAKAKAEAEAKTAATSEQITVPSEPKPTPSGSSASMNKAFFLLAACLVAIVVPIVIASFMNSMQYTLKTVDGALELWQGSFAPIGKHHVLTMPGAVPPESIQETYGKMEVFPLVCKYYLDRADSVVDATSIPDFEKIRLDLNQAMAYATTKHLREIVYARFDRIDFITLIYKADVAAEMNTPEGYKTAIAFLESASRLELGEPEAEMVKRKLEQFSASLAAILPDSSQK